MDEIEADTADAEDGLDLRELLLPNGSFPACRDRFSVSVSRAALSGWVKQPSPCCCAASLSGAVNIVMGMHRSDPGSLSAHDGIKVLLHSMQTKQDAKARALTRLLGGKGIDTTPLIEAVKSAMAEEGRALDAMPKPKPGVTAVDCMRCVRRLVWSQIDDATGTVVVFDASNLALQCARAQLALRRAREASAEAAHAAELAMAASSQTAAAVVAAAEGGGDAGEAEAAAAAAATEAEAAAERATQAAAAVTALPPGPSAPDPSSDAWVYQEPVFRALRERYWEEALAAASATALKEEEQECAASPADSAAASVGAAGGADSDSVANSEGDDGDDDDDDNADDDDADPAPRVPDKDKEAAAAASEVIVISPGAAQGKRGKPPAGPKGKKLKKKGGKKRAAAFTVAGGAGGKAAASKPPLWRSTMKEMFAKLVGGYKLRRPRPSTAAFGNWGITEGARIIAGGDAGIAAGLGDVGDNAEWRALGANLSARLFMGGKGKGAKAEHSVSAKDDDETVLKQWNALRSEFLREDTAFVYHLKNHYALLFAMREWVERIEDTGADEVADAADGAEGAATSADADAAVADSGGPAPIIGLGPRVQGNLRIVRQVLTTRRGQRPSAWVDFEEMRAHFMKWAGHKLVAIKRTSAIDDSLAPVAAQVAAAREADAVDAVDATGAADAVDKGPEAI